MRRVGERVAPTVVRAVVLVDPVATPSVLSVLAGLVRVPMAAREGARPRVAAPAVVAMAIEDVTIAMIAMDAGAGTVSVEPADRWAVPVVTGMKTHPREPARVRVRVIAPRVALMSVALGGDSTTRGTADPADHAPTIDAARAAVESVADHEVLVSSVRSVMVSAARRVAGMTATEVHGMDVRSVMVSAARRGVEGLVALRGETSASGHSPRRSAARRRCVAGPEVVARREILLRRPNGTTPVGSTKDRFVRPLGQHGRVQVPRRVAREHGTSNPSRPWWMSSRRFSARTVQGARSGDTKWPSRPSKRSATRRHSVS